MVTTPLQFADTWILVGLLHASEEGHTASLRDLIQAADVVNHAIITHAELETGISRLVSAGHVIAEQGGFSVSRQVRTFWMTRTKSWSSLYKSWKALAAHIGAPPATTGPLPETEDEYYVSKAAYEAAVTGYLASALDTLRGIK